jgi:TubC N-terminal docking domain
MPREAADIFLEELLEDLHRRGIKLRATGDGRLRYHPKDRIDRPTLELLKRYKTELLEVVPLAVEVPPERVKSWEDWDGIHLSRSRRLWPPEARTNEIVSVEEILRRNTAPSYPEEWWRALPGGCDHDPKGPCPQCLGHVKKHGHLLDSPECFECGRMKLLRGLTVDPDTGVLGKESGFGYESYTCFLAWQTGCDGPPDNPHRRAAECVGCLWSHPEWYGGRRVSREDVWCEHGERTWWPCEGCKEEAG